MYYQRSEEMPWSDRRLLRSWSVPFFPYAIVRISLRRGSIDTNIIRTNSCFECMLFHGNNQVVLNLWRCVYLNWTCMRIWCYIFFLSQKWNLNKSEILRVFQLNVWCYLRTELHHRQRRLWSAWASSQSKRLCIVLNILQPVTIAIFNSRKNSQKLPHLILKQYFNCFKVVAASIWKDECP